MNEYALARKYAKAYLAVFGSQLPGNFLDCMNVLRDYCASHHEAFFYIKLSLIPSALKERILLRAFEQVCKVELVGFSHLIALLAEQKRLYLIALVIRALGEEYKIVQGIEEFTVFSAQQLSQAQVAQVTEALAALTQKKVTVSVEDDSSLIAGIRAVSRFHTWEYSVRQMLRDYRRSR